MTPWLDAKTYYLRRWGASVGRIGVDGGFSCPNRGPDRAIQGCAFCADQGNRPPYQSGAGDLADQIRKAKAFSSERYGTNLFSLYFQSYSSTWAPVEVLREVYDRGLAEGPFVDLTVGTRPDCVPEPVADLLSSYRTDNRDVWVELGLQSSSDVTLERIGRGHDSGAFRTAAARLRARKVPFTAHVMYGLPGEGKSEFLETVRFALAEGASGLKFHDLLLVSGTRLYRDWEAGLVKPVDSKDYLEALAEALAGVPMETVVWRVCSDPEDRKGPVSPGKKWPKNLFLNRLSAEVRARTEVSGPTEPN